MWKIINISAHHINTFQKLSYDVHQNVATVVFGENKDNAGQERNGSGKSSLLEAIAFAITGEPLRDVKSAEEIINDMYEDATVRLELVSENMENHFMIERSIARKGAQVIHTYMNDQEVVQPTVLDYNKYILSEIGLTKDDIYGNFILCRNRYKSFFKAPDKEKKEIINRFSNGVMVDEAIAKLEVDITSAKEVKTEADLTLARVKGSVEALTAEIEEAEENAENAKKSKEDKLTDIKLKIADYRKKIRNNEELIKEDESRKNSIEKLRDVCEEYEQGGESLEHCHRELDRQFFELDLTPLKNWEEVMKEQKLKELQLVNKIELLQKQHEDNLSLVTKAKIELHKYQVQYDTLKDEHDKQVESDKVLAEKIKTQNAENNLKIDEMDAELEKKDRQLADLKKELENIEIKLSGKITCPSCRHEFLLGTKSLEEYKADREKNIAAQQSLNEEIDTKTENYNKACQVSDDLNQQLEKIRDDYRKRQAEINANYDIVSKQNQTLDSYISERNKIQRDIDSVDADIDSLQKEIANIRTSMFDEAIDIIDEELLLIKRTTANQKNEIESAKASIEALQDSIKTIEEATEKDTIASLKKSLEKHKRGMIEAEKEANLATDHYNTLAAQKTHFSEFKTYLANQKINAIAQITNDFLEEIGSDIRVQLDGYTLLKSGKVRDKISVNLTRNGEDCGSFGKLSGGEQARVCLANILAMHRLTNMNCDDGKGLDILIIDEILDASDETGIASYCESLNNLQMTAIVVTQGYVAENYPYQLKVTKENGVSTI